MLAALSSPAFLVGSALTTWLRPTWRIAVGELVAILLLLAINGLLRLVVPKVAAIAWATYREAVSQPLFYVLLLLGIVALVGFAFLSYYTMGEDVKMYKDMGLRVIMALSVGMAVWTASLSIAEEIEGQIALTVLSKPIGRREFILGKFLGTLAPVAIMFLVLGAALLIGTSFKVVYDAGESAKGEPTWEECQQAMGQLVPGLMLTFMEAVVLSSIGVAIATRLPLVPNLIICTFVYLLGHLMPTLVGAASTQFAIAHFVAELLATILPALEIFDIYSAIATGNEVPWSYLGVAAVYCLLYTAGAMLVALLLFEDRDLA